LLLLPDHVCGRVTVEACVGGRFGGGGVRVPWWPGRLRRTPAASPRPWHRFRPRCPRPRRLRRLGSVALVVNRASGMTASPPPRGWWTSGIRSSGRHTTTLGRSNSTLSSSARASATRSRSSSPSPTASAPSAHRDLNTTARACLYDAATTPELGKREAASVLGIASHRRAVSLSRNGCGRCVRERLATGTVPPGPLPLNAAGRGRFTILVGPNGLRLRRETALLLGAAMCAKLV